MIHNAMLFCLVLAVLVFNAPARGQGFSGRTNDIHLDFRSGTAVTAALPAISWNNPRLEFTNSQEPSILIDAGVRSESPLRSLVLSIGDGTQILAEKSVDLSLLEDGRLKQSILLMDGQNVINITAENMQGGKVSSTRTVLSGKDALTRSVMADRKDYALLFATDAYDHWDDLVNPIDDARTIATQLREKYGFEVEIVENPETDQVFSKLRDYAERRFRPQDQLLIFFAGHGYFDDAFGEGFVVARNSLLDDKAKTSYISHSRLRQIINNIPVEHVLLTMDVCFGGTFDPLVAAVRGAETGETDESEFLVRKFGHKTRKYLTSGGKTYVSDGIPGKHSPFTLKLLQALSEGGGTDRILTLAEMRTYIDKLKPEPRLGSFGDDRPEGDFIFINRNR